jgi:prepilin-type N-terminal cleavage/methylation domain-containing protein
MTDTNYKVANMNSREGGFTPLEKKTYSNSLTGFTFLEIMVALAILSVAVIAVFHVVNYHADVAFEHTLSTRMFLLAKEKISELKIDPKNDSGVIPDTDFSYETFAVNINESLKAEGEEILELRAVIRGNGKEIELSELFNKR